jgi:hypothetical protein
MAFPSTNRLGHVIGSTLSSLAAAQQNANNQSVTAGANAKTGVREVKFHRPFGSYSVEALNGWMKERKRFGY